ncbi:ATP-binding protein [Chloroflexota bacterium]
MQGVGKFTESVKHLLATSQLFEGLTDDELDRIAGFCSEEVYEAGTTIISEGEVANKLYIVEEGKVVLEMTLRLGPGSGRQGNIDVVTKGQMFGWSAIAETQIFTMSARCVEETKLIALDGVGLRHLLEAEYHTGYKVMKRLVGVVSSRLRHARDTLAHVLSIASHDLKSPLAAVESYHRVMLDGYAGEITEKQKNMLLRSSERIKGLLNLIDNILDISRIDARELKMGAISLLKVVEDTRGVIEPLAKGKGLKLEVEVTKDLPLITGSPERLQQVFNNLLGNAVKFTPEGGIVTLKVSEADDHILVEVIDTGIGISPEELPKLFTDFYRGIRIDSTGAGLGLGISKRIIEAHRGKIWVESPRPESRVGSKFTFTLPKNLATIRGK